MNIVAIFDPAVITSDTFTVPQSSANGKMVIYNESNISLTFSFQNGNTAYVPAWMAVIYAGTFGNVNVTWQQQVILVSSNPPVSQVIVEVYDCNELVPGTFPTALVRQTNVGNTVSTSGGTLGSVVNDGNVAATQFIEATVLGDSGSAVSLTNDAVLILGTITNKGSLNLKGPATIGGDVLLTTGKIGKAVSADIIDASGADTYIKCRAGGVIHFQQPNGSTTWDMGNVNGDLTCQGGGGINYNIGRIKDINNGSALSGTVNHGLSGTPGAVLATCNSAGSSATVGASSYTSTQFTLTIGGALNGRWVAYR